MRRNPVRPLERILIGRVRHFAEKKGIPLSHLADRAGVSRSVLWELLAGHMSPTLDLTQRLADALEVEPLDLLQGRPVALPRRSKIARK